MGGDEVAAPVYSMRQTHASSMRRPCRDAAMVGMHTLRQMSSRGLTHLAAADAGREWQHVAVEAHLVVEIVLVAGVPRIVPIPRDRVLQHSGHVMNVSSVLKPIAYSTSAKMLVTVVLTRASEVRCVGSLALRYEVVSWGSTHREKAMTVDRAAACPSDNQRHNMGGSPACGHRSCTGLAAGICATGLTSAVGAS